MNPPTLIGGSTPLDGGIVRAAFLPLFDAYNCTCFANADVLYDDLFCLFTSAGLDPQKVDGPPIPHYARNLLLLDPKGHRLAQVRAGGQNYFPFVEVKGEPTMLVAEYLRSNYRHRPSRIDSAQNVQGAGLFEKLAEVALQIREQHKVKYETLLKPGQPDRGATLYLGSRKSQVFLRVYQPGLKLAEEEGRTGDQITQQERNAVRVEVEFKPQNKRAKELSATMSPAAVWSTSHWLADFVRALFDMDLQPVSISKRRESDRARALRFMGAQYSTHLRALLDECGGDLAKFGAVIANLAGISDDQGEQAA